MGALVRTGMDSERYENNEIRKVTFVENLQYVAPITVETNENVQKGKASNSGIIIALVFSFLVVSLIFGGLFVYSRKRKQMRRKSHCSDPEAPVIHLPSEPVEEIWQKALGIFSDKESNGSDTHDSEAVSSNVPRNEVIDDTEKALSDQDEENDEEDLSLNDKQEEHKNKNAEVSTNENDENLSTSEHQDMDEDKCKIEGIDLGNDKEQEVTIIQSVSA